MICGGCVGVPPAGGTRGPAAVSSRLPGGPVALATQEATSPELRKRNEEAMSENPDLAIMRFFQAVVGTCCRIFLPTSKRGRLALREQCRREAIKQRRENNFEAAEAALVKALEVSQSLGSEAELLAESLDELGDLYEKSGRYQRAESRYLQALKIREEHPGKRCLGLISTLNALALLYYVEGKFQQAEPVFRRLLHTIEEHLGPECRELSVALENYAALCRRLKRDQDSDALRARAAEIRKRLQGGVRAADSFRGTPD